MLARPPLPPLVVALAAVAISCAEPGAAPQLGESISEVVYCAPGPTVDGIDVSKWQGNINWGQVAGDGIDFAFIRVSHGINTLDEYFDANWAGAKSAGILRGPYQYFESKQDPVQQANVLIDRVKGDYGPGDLPPVIDVEDSMNNPGPSTYASNVRKWIDHVESELGVKPIIYTGKYYWQDWLANSTEFVGYPLWLAHYTTSCPNTPDAWPKWTLWQYTASGRVNGVSGDVDRNVFDGTLDELKAMGGQAECGDGLCTGGETTSSCLKDCPPCRVLDDEDIVDNGDACFFAGGPAEFLRDEESLGWENSLIWTNTHTGEQIFNFARWTLFFAEGGTYRLEAHVPGSYAEAQRATYLVQHSEGETASEIDQSAAAGWIEVGTFQFDAETAYQVELGDNTGEDTRKLVFDALRTTRIGGGKKKDDDEEDGEEDPEPVEPDGKPEISSCSAAGGQGGLTAGLLLALLGLVRRHRFRLRACRSERS